MVDLSIFFKMNVDHGRVQCFLSLAEVDRVYLVGGLEHDFYFPIQLGIIIPSDFHIYFSEGWLNRQPVIIAGIQRESADVVQTSQ